MPNIKSTKKRLRQSKTRQVSNQSVKTRIKTARRKFFETEAEGNKDAIDTAYRTYCSVLDSGVQKGVIKKNVAIRRKTRAANRSRATA
ncbi:MAG: 30S ribosomal protein S20 [Kiritimatiellae bacterium]|nr:30S ribosomal protein S20 [Kiritimatiellia bacterium]